MTRKIVIGSRGSDLALWQARFVKAQSEALFPGTDFEIRIISTTGDEVVDVALSKIGDKGLFTRQIETELLAGRIDLAVHSLKDLQTEQPEGLTIGAVCAREIPNDAFISNKFASIDELPPGSRVATGSLRRKSQLLNYRPDLIIDEIRGNVPTRLRKFDASDLDGMILAYAGLHRLGLNARVSQEIPFDIMLPAVGQGAVAIEVRSDENQLSELMSGLDDVETHQCVTAERTFLRRLEGGCQVPIGAHATIDDQRLRLEGMVGSLDGKVVYRDQVIGEAADGEALGNTLAEKLITMGAVELLDESRNQSDSAAGMVV